MATNVWYYSAFGMKPKVYKRQGMWWVQNPGYHVRRYRDWRTAITAAIEWWF